MSHGHPATRSNTQVLQDTMAVCDAAGLPKISLSAAQANFLALHCRVAGVTRALEVGTLGGYSAIWMTSENPQLHLTTIEYDLHHYSTAKKNIEHAGLADRIELIHGAAIDVLPRLLEEVRASKRRPYEHVFIDADKSNNWNYFQLSKAMVKPNSSICVDNVVKEGALVDFDDNESNVRGCREVVEKAGKEPGVDSVVLQTVGKKGYDGWLWAVVS